MFEKLRKSSLKFYSFFILILILSISPNAESFSQIFKKEKKKSDYSFRLTDIVCSYVWKLYVYPDRIKPDKMIVDGLKRIAQSIPELLIDYDEESNFVYVHIDDHSMKIDLNNVDSLVTTSNKLKKAFAFIAKNKQTEKVEDDDVMYEGLNGMVSHLDPHTVILPPKAFDEFKIGTSGQFGGLGMVVGIREGILTVISPIEGTPAHRAGLKAGDQIIEIDGESTINMTLSESVNKLRGKPNTLVLISVLKHKAAEPVSISIKREIIKIPTVDEKILEDGIGYIKIRNFQNDTAVMLQKHIKSLKKSNGKIKGLVIDLRNNSGGLLEQAIKVTDQFIDSGNIVVTVGPGGQNTDIQEARREKTDELFFPIVVLINSSSASGAEIVVGALKENDRCVVIGNRSFGKGSVQQLIDLINGAALKLTMAKYLTPFFNEVQSEGISPDIVFTPVTISEDDINLFRERTYLREEDLLEHRNIQKKSEHKSDTNILEVKYLKDSEVKEENGEDDSTDKDKEEEFKDEDPYKAGDLTKDNLVQFAKMIIKDSDKFDRNEILRDIHPLIEKIEAAEEKKIFQAFKEIGIDWTNGKTQELPFPVTNLSIELTESENKIEKTKDTTLVNAGDKLSITVSITNKGKGTMYQVRGISESKNLYLDKLEFVFGKIPAGATESYTKTVEIPKNVADRKDPITIKFNESNDNAPDNIDNIVRIRSLTRPQFAYSYQISDKGGSDKTGNNDGLIQADEDITLTINVKNVGKNKAEKISVALKNVTEEEVFVSKGMAELEELLPGKSGTVDMELKVKNEASFDKFDMDILIRESTFGAFTLNTNTFYVNQKDNAPKLKKVHSKLKVTKDEAPILGSRVGNSVQIAQLKKGTILNSDSKISGSLYRIDLPNNQYAWISDDNVEKCKDNKDSNLEKIELLMQHIPPTIELNMENLDLLVENDEVTISGIARDDKEIKSVYAFVSNEKIYFKSKFTELQSKYSHKNEKNNKQSTSNSGNNKNKITPKGTIKELPFSIKIKLKDDSNGITIIANDSDDLNVSKSIVITKISEKE